MKTIPDGFTINQPTPEGRALGSQLDRLFNMEQPKAEAQFPGSTERCKSCAFRAGTYPNGCPETVIDAFNCAVSGRPFYCHVGVKDGDRPTTLCSGWAVLQGSDSAQVLGMLSEARNR